MALTILSTLLHTIEGDKRFHLAPGLGQMDKEPLNLCLMVAVAYTKTATRKGVNSDGFEMQ